MSADFEIWPEEVAPRDKLDPGGRPAGTDRVLREIFDQRGPSAVTELRLAGQQIQMDLARGAVALVVLQTSTRPPRRDATSRFATTTSSIAAAVLKLASSAGADPDLLSVAHVPAKDHSRAFVRFDQAGRTWYAAFMYVAGSAVLVTSNSLVGDETALSAVPHSIFCNRLSLRVTNLPHLRAWSGVCVDH